MSGKRNKEIRRAAKSLTRDMPLVDYTERGSQSGVTHQGIKIPGTSRKLNPMSLRGLTKRMKLKAKGKL